MNPKGGTGAALRRPCHLRRTPGSGHYAGTAVRLRAATGSSAGLLSRRLPSSTPRMMIAPPAQIQLTSGLMKIRNEADQSEAVPVRTTYTSEIGRAHV